MAEMVERMEPHFTYGDYVQWDGDERWELIEGEPYCMSPAPNERHQGILMELGRQVSNFLVGNLCRPYIAPLDVRLPEADEKDEDVDTVVQPDLLVVCDPEKLDSKGVRGAPDFIVEILSPRTTMRDQYLKAELYKKHGVKEYWIIDPDTNRVRVHLQGEWDDPKEYEGKGRLEVATLPGLEVDLDMVFRE